MGTGCIEEEELREIIRSCWSEGGEGRDLPWKDKVDRGLVRFEGSLLQGVFGCSLPSEIRIPSLVLVLTCAGRFTSEFH